MPAKESKIMNPKWGLQKESDNSIWIYPPVFLILSSNTLTYNELVKLGVR